VLLLKRALLNYQFIIVFKTKLEIVYFIAIVKHSGGTVLNEDFFKKPFVLSKSRLQNFQSALLEGKTENKFFL
jgi:hypothetical protein